MQANPLFESSAKFAAHLRALRKRRKQTQIVQASGRKRRSLSSAERQTVFNKTAGRCHICGGEIDGDWEADHVFAHAQGGAHAIDNYLPAHSLCNNYRWFYGTEEFQWILKLGVWLRTRIELEDAAVLKVVDRFVRHEARRHARRKPPVT